MSKLIIYFKQVVINDIEFNNMKKLIIVYENNELIHNFITLCAEILLWIYSISFNY